MSAQLDTPLDGRSLLAAAATLSGAGVADNVLESALHQAHAFMSGARTASGATAMAGRASVVSSSAHDVLRVAIQMSDANLPDGFVFAAAELGLKSKPARELMAMWAEETDADEREELIADLQDLIDDHEAVARREVQSIKLNDLDAIAKNVQAFKDSLRLVVEEKGGISKLSELTKIPQPSLSRFFGSTAMPRRATLLKIGKALGLEKIELDAQWIL